MPRRRKIQFNSRAVDSTSNPGPVRKRSLIETHKLRVHLYSLAAIIILGFACAFNCTASIILQLLTEDSALKPFKSYKKSVKKLKRVGDVLTIVVVAGCCYEIYVKAVMREEARKQ